MGKIKYVMDKNTLTGDSNSESSLSGHSGPSGFLYRVGLAIGFVGNVLGLRPAPKTPPIETNPERIAGAERLLTLLTEQVTLIDFYENRYAETWPTFGRTEAGALLLESIRPEAAAIAVHVRERLTRLKAGEPLASATGEEVEVLKLSRGVYQLCDMAEAEVLNDRV
jgi:hypothetical protein